MHILFTDHFSDPGKAVVQMCVSVCECVKMAFDTLVLFTTV